MKVLMCEIGELPTVIDIKGNKYEIQKLIDGEMSIVPLDDGIDICFNEAGKRMNLPFNRYLLDAAYRVKDIIAGNCLIFAYDKRGRLIDMTEEQIIRFMNLFSTNMYAR